MLTGRGRILRAGAGPDAINDVVNVIDGVALDNSDIFIAVGDGIGIAVFSGNGIGAVRVVIAPIGDRDRLAGGGVVICIALNEQN